jgi:hypothetical protein
MGPLILLLAWAGQDKSSTDLRWRPLLKDAIAFRLILDLQSTGSNIRIQGDLGMLVSSVDSTGNYSVRTTVKNKSLSVDGVRKKLPDDPPSVEKYSVRGQKLAGGSRSNETEINPLDLLDLITEASLPAKVVVEDDHWQQTISEDKRLGRMKATVKCHLLKPEVVAGYPVWRVTFEYRQALAESVEADGSFCVSVADGSLVAIEANMRNLRLTDDGNLATANVSMRRTEPASRP